MATYDITALDSPFEFDTTLGASTSVDRIPTKDWVICSWIRSTTLPYVQVFEKNPSTGAMTALGSPLDLSDAGATDSGTSVVAINATNAIVFYNGGGSDGFAQLLSIDGSGNVTTNGSALEYDTTLGAFPSAILWDSTHVLNAWTGSGNDGYAQVFSFNTGTGVITAEGTAFEYDINIAFYASLVKVKAGQAALLYYGIDAVTTNVAMQCLLVNESTWAVTAGGNLDIADFAGGAYTSLSLIGSSGSDYLVLGAFNYLNSTNNWYLGVFTIGNDNSVTQLGSLVNIGVGGTTRTTYSVSTVMIDGNNAIVIYYDGTANDAIAKSVEIDKSTGAITVIDTITFYTDLYGYSDITSFGDGTFVTTWSGSGSDGFVQTIRADAIATLNNGGAFLLNMI